MSVRPEAAQLTRMRGPEHERALGEVHHARFGRACSAGGGRHLYWLPRWPPEAANAQALLWLQ
jgi:hypothetical protein